MILAVHQQVVNSNPRYCRAAERETSLVDRKISWLYARVNGVFSNREKQEKHDKKMGFHLEAWPFDCRLDSSTHCSTKFGAVTVLRNHRSSMSHRIPLPKLQADTTIRDKELIVVSCCYQRSRSRLASTAKRNPPIVSHLPHRALAR